MRKRAWNRWIDKETQIKGKCVRECVCDREGERELGGGGGRVKMTQELFERKKWRQKRKEK